MIRSYLIKRQQMKMLIKRKLNRCEKEKSPESSPNKARWELKMTKKIGAQIKRI